MKNTVNSTKMDDTETNKKWRVCESPEVKFQLDNGLNVTLINEQTWKKIHSPILLKTK